MKKSVRVHYGNLAKHGVRPHEVEECFRRDSFRYLRKARRNFYLMVAQTRAGRYLEILFEERKRDLFVFHAIDARSRHVKLLKRRGKRR